MEQQDHEPHGQPGQKQHPVIRKQQTAQAEPPMQGSVPSADEEIKPGINQDTPTTGQFSSEPSGDASGSADGQ